MSHLGYELELSGLVQGVGFRPLVYEIALNLGLRGEVYNDGFGVRIFLLCNEAGLNEFLRLLKLRLPPLARIDKLKKTLKKLKPYQDFRISNSKQSPKSSPILSDFSLCKECKKEFYDPKNPRFLYPFITCTHCGPRFSIIKALPYDRKNTSMNAIPMCDFCKNEYENPLNRRFHAQPISCPKCEIKVHLKDKNAKILASSKEAFKLCAKLLKEGKILALKGMGGFHLICDALNLATLKELRKRKNRPYKPFALMCKDIEQAKKLAFINEYEANLLQGSLSPIVLLRAKKDLSLIAPDTDKIGIMLAYTPLHLLLFEYFDGVLVATSANLSGESIIFKEELLLDKLGGIFDFYLTYEREITNPSDDSIAQVIEGKTMFLRTSRALNPCYLSIDSACEKSILALGSELKNEFVIYHQNKLIVSPYIGDLKSLDTRERFLSLLEFFKRTYEIDFDMILCDKHPHFDYVKDFKTYQNYKISHHYAHFCAAFFEAGLKEKALAFICDGTGYGEDGLIWGGEIFLGDLKGYERLGHFENFKLINSDIKNLQNLALSVIWHYGLENEAQEFLTQIPQNKLRNLKKIYNNSKLFTSSLGRIIDAFAALVFGIEKLDYEAQSGLLCEKFYDESLDFSYKFHFKNGAISFKEVILGALKDEKTKAVTGFLNALANFIVEFSQTYKFKLILSGGVFQNKTLLEILKRKKLEFFTPLKFPCNDSQIALGQMVHFLKIHEYG